MICEYTLLYVQLHFNRAQLVTFMSYCFILFLFFAIKNQTKHGMREKKSLEKDVVKEP